MLHSVFPQVSLCHCKKDFNAWAYSLPQSNNCSSSSCISSVVEDIKFPYNAWNFLRLNLFYQLGRPQAISDLHKCAPTCDSSSITNEYNKLFHRYVETNSYISSEKFSIALTPCHSTAIPLQELDWEYFFKESKISHKKGVQLVLGMENGLSDSLVQQCDFASYIPQYGSVGSLSMICALAIAIHLAVSSQKRIHRAMRQQSRQVVLPRLGHMARSKNSYINAPPHEENLIGLSNDTIKAVLAERRERYALQLSVVVHNEMGDRNIGAIMRNANVFNCEKMIVLKRKKFNRRGAMGTQNLLSTLYSDSVNSAECKKYIHEGYEVWVLFQDYPYLHLYSPFGEQRTDHLPFVPPSHIDFQRWLTFGHNESDPRHPILQHFPHLQGNEVYLDCEQSVLDAVRDVHRRGQRGIILAIPEEGATPHPSLVSIAKKLVFTRCPVNDWGNANNALAKGLSGSLYSAIAFERIRSCIDTLHCLPVSEGNY